MNETYIVIDLEPLDHLFNKYYNLLIFKWKDTGGSPNWRRAALQYVNLNG